MGLAKEERGMLYIMPFFKVVFRSERVNVFGAAASLARRGGKVIPRFCAMCRWI